MNSRRVSRQRISIGLDENVCTSSATWLNQILADIMVLRDLYKKCHWQVAGEMFYPLHLLFGKHNAEQVDLMDAVAERIQLLGGISIASAADVVEMTSIPPAPQAVEPVPDQLARLLGAHEIILLEVRTAAQLAAQSGDDGTNDLLVSQVIRTNELQVWFLARHLMGVPREHADQTGTAQKSAGMRVVATSGRFATES